MKKIITFCILCIFTFDLIIPSQAKVVRRRNSKKSKVRKERVSSNNKYRSKEKDRKLKLQLSKYNVIPFKKRLHNAIKDYETALKLYLVNNNSSGANNEGELFDNLLSQFNRKCSIKGIKNIWKEMKLYIVPEVIPIIERDLTSVCDLYKNVEFEDKLLSWIEILREFKVINLTRQNKGFRLRDLNTQIRTFLNQDRSSSVLYAGAVLYAASRGTARVSSTINRSDTALRDGTYESQDYSSDYYDDTDDLFSNPAFEASSYDQSLASQQKGYEDHSSEEKSKRSQALLLIALGAALIAYGIYTYTTLAQEAYMAAKCPVTQVTPTGCEALAQAAKSQVQNQGLMMIAGGAVLLYMGMEKLGEADALKDEQNAQDRKNAEIDAARKRIEDLEEAEREYEWKREQYRKRQLEEQERRNRENRRNLQNAVQSAQ